MEPIRFFSILLICALVASAPLSLAADTGPAGIPAAQTDTGNAENVRPGGPQIQFEKLEHDFGRQYAGGELTYTFEFKNLGSETLVIDKVKAS